ncbi:MAG: hypothetical protein WDM85_11650 [Caulobacteraceae bacterium]
MIRTILGRASTGGILTGALLAFSRISGETAPLLFTALNNQYMSGMGDGGGQPPSGDVQRRPVGLRRSAAPGLGRER